MRLIGCCWLLSSLLSVRSTGVQQDPDSNESSLQMVPDYVIDDLLDGEQLLASGSSGGSDETGQESSSISSKARSLTRRQLQKVFSPDSFNSNSGDQVAAVSSQGDFADSYPVTGYYFDPQQQQQRTSASSSSIRESLKTLVASPSDSDMNPNIQNSNENDNEDSPLEQAGQQQRQETQLLRENQNKVGPQFLREPPSFIHYLNSSDLVIPCAASGNPTPTIVSVQSRAMATC